MQQMFDVQFLKYLFFCTRFQPTNNLTVAKGDGVGWGVPPPPPPVGWPAPPPNDCTNPGTPVGGCTENLAVSAYLPSTSMFF